MPRLATQKPSRRVLDDAGFLLVEVLVSALLVALVAVAMFTGFGAVSRATAEERLHNQAAQLAAEAQEQLRSNPASVLSGLYGRPRTFTRALGSTIYTVKQAAEPLGSSGSGTGCSASERAAQTGANVSVETSVTWKSPAPRSNPPVVREHGIITPPVGSALEVDVLNGSSPPEAGVSGVSPVVTFTPVSSITPVTLQGTTNARGCVVFTGIQSTVAKVEIPEKLNFVTPSGALKIASKEVAIAPNVTTHYLATLNEGGQLKAEFTYNGPSNPSGETVTGDTFVAFNNAINLEPNFEVGAAGATPFEYEAAGERKYKALTGQYATSAVTPASASYARGDLFPFASAWNVYAGDCKANDVSSEDRASVTVVAGQTTSVKVPLSYVKLGVYSGSELTPGVLVTTPYPVTITDTACTSEAAPDNSFAANIKHTQSTSNGHLEHPFQPFGKAELCMSYNVLNTHRLFKYAYTLTKAAGTTIPVYLAELPLAGVTHEVLNTLGEKVPVTETITSSPSPVACP